MRTLPAAVTMAEGIHGMLQAGFGDVERRHAPQAAVGEPEGRRTQPEIADQRDADSGGQQHGHDQQRTAPGAA
jgi:hypothetical protein